MYFFGSTKLYQNIGGFSLFLHKFHNFVDNVSEYFQKRPKLKVHAILINSTFYDIYLMEGEIKMEDKTNKKYDILMIIWGLLLGPIESLFIFSSLIEKIDISFIKVPYVKTLFILAIISLCFRIITYIIQLPYKRKLENKKKIMKNRHLALICSLISITVLFFILWSIDMSGDPEDSLLAIIVLTLQFVSVQIPFLLPVF